MAVNPAASFGRGRDAGSIAERGLADAGHDVLGLECESAAELVEAVRSELESPPDALVVVGGDGMVHLATNLLVGTSVPLGLVPSGTGNDVARALGIPYDAPARAVHVLLECLERAPRVIDVGRIRLTDGSTRHFAGAFSAGFDAIVNERANHMTWPKGSARYTLAMVLELVRLRPRTYVMTLDDDPPLSFQGMLVSVANGVSLGGGMRITPDAILDDGLFDVLVVDPLSRLRFLQIFPRVFRGTHITDPRVHVHRAARVRLQSVGIVTFADGERVGPLPQDLEIIPRALRVFAPGGGERASSQDGRIPGD